MLDLHRNDGGRMQKIAVQARIPRPVRRQLDSASKRKLPQLSCAGAVKCCRRLWLVVCGL